MKNQSLNRTKASNIELKFDLVEQKVARYFKNVATF